MDKNDMIIVSVDDHVVEPPDMFERHLPDKYRDLAPRVVHKDDGTDVWDFQGMEIPNIGLNAVAGRPREEY
ncbi:MAG: amidohydrolase, partial [Acidimicrobiia bacterium]|nr:amidohydrolase [Acidimicrobiia bacterium]